MRRPEFQDLVVDVVQRLPQGALSRAWGWLARRQRPRPGVALFKRGFARAVGIDMAEAAAPMATYPSLEALFVRTLRPGVRPLDADPDALVSPVDGTMGCSGTVTAGQLLQVKGRGYALAALLGDAAAAARFEGGAFATLYLAPRDYHRVHAPCDGAVSEARLIPGGLLPVFAAAVARVDGLFARNERIVTYLDDARAGRVAVVMVGATLVGRMTLAYDPDVYTNQHGAASREMTYQPPRPLRRGGELGAFTLGSTVVLLAEPGRVVLAVPPVGTPVRMGTRIGRLIARPVAGVAG